MTQSITLYDLPADITRYIIELTVPDVNDIMGTVHEQITGVFSGMKRKTTGLTMYDINNIMNSTNTIYGLSLTDAIKDILKDDSRIKYDLDFLRCIFSCKYDLDFVTVNSILSPILVKDGKAAFQRVHGRDGTTWFIHRDLIVDSDDEDEVYG